MSGSTQYTVASNASYDGTKCPHHDVSIGSGVDIAVTALGSGGTMAALATAMQRSVIPSRSHILRDKRRSTATPLATGREALLARDFPTHPHLDRFDHLDRLLAVVLIFGA